MKYRVRNLGRPGDAALKFLGMTLEPGFTSPPIEIQNGSSLEDMIEAWVNEGIALVVPADDAGTAGQTHQKAVKAAVLNLSEAQEAAMRRKTSLAATAPASPFAQPMGRPTALKPQMAKKFSAEDIKKLAGRPQPLSSAGAQEVVEEQEFVETIQDDEQIPADDNGMETDEAIMEAEAETAKARRLSKLEDDLGGKTKKALLAKTEEVGMDVNPAMLKGEIVNILALHIIENVPENEEDAFIESF